MNQAPPTNNVLVIGNGGNVLGLDPATGQPRWEVNTKGAGAVELGFLGGAAGDLGAEQGWLLLAWRVYTNGIGVVLGVALAAHIYGWPALRQLVGRWSNPH